MPAALFAAAMALVWLPGAAWAACTPTTSSGSPASGTVTCTGTTTNQNSPNGYGTGNETGATVTVEQGASVTGTDRGIYLSDGTVVNSGTVTGAAGIVAQNNDPSTNLTVVNSGTIAGTGGVGISVDTTGNITNSGTIFGSQGAIVFHNVSSTNDTLTILPGSLLIGTIEFGSGSDTVNFQTGNQNLTFLKTGGGTVAVNVSSGIPYVVVDPVKTVRVVTVDPTSFALTGRTLMDFTGSVSAILDGRVNAMGSSAGQAVAALLSEQPLAYVVRQQDRYAERRRRDRSCLCRPDAGPGARPCAYSDGTTLWGRGFGGHRDQPASGVLLGATTDYYGGLIGGDRQLSPTLRLGAFLGGGNTDTQVNLGMDHDSSTVAFGGVYARKDFGAGFLGVAVQAGHSSNDESRTVNNNTVSGTGIETAKASFGGWYIAPEATLGRAFQMPASEGSFVLTPSVRLRYLHAAFDGYTETGSTANLTVGARSLDNFEERVQLKATTERALASGSVLTTDLHGGVIGSQRLGGRTINATLLSQAIPFATPGAKNVWGGYARRRPGTAHRPRHVLCLGRGHALLRQQQRVCRRGGRQRRLLTPAA